MGAVGPLEIIEAGHPVPDESSAAAGRRALALADALGEDDQVLLLISGGGSALFEAPAEGVSLADVADTTRQLLACGADITEINTLRKRLSPSRAGGWRSAARPRRCLPSC
jgi:hydroxypyruvate reductase